MDSAALIKGLSEKGFVVIPSFLNTDEVAKLSEEIDSLAPRFIQAGIGREQSHSLQPTIRTDKTLWLEPESLSPLQTHLWLRLNELKDEINHALFLGLWELGGFYAVYGPGGFYEKHRDTFKDDDARILSVIVYLNTNWKQEDGGELLIYPNQNSDNSVKIEPRGGSLVCFLSKDIPHQVCQSNITRKSFTGWFKARVSN